MPGCPATGPWRAGGKRGAARKPDGPMIVEHDGSNGLKQQGACKSEELRALRSLVEAASCVNQESPQANHDQTETLEYLVH